MNYVNLGAPFYPLFRESIDPDKLRRFDSSLKHWEGEKKRKRKESVSVLSRDSLFYCISSSFPSPASAILDCLRSKFLFFEPKVDR